MVAPIAFEVLPGALRGQELRNWLRTDGIGLFRTFGTTSEALSFARDLGLQIRTQDFYSIARQVQNVITSGDKLMGYSTDQLIPLAWHVQDHGMELSSEFQYRIQMFGADSATGFLKSQWMTIASDRQLTIDEVKDVANTYVGEGGASGEIEDYVFGQVEPLRR